MIKKEKFGVMLSLKNNEISTVPLADIAGKLKTVDPDSGIVKEAKGMLGIFLWRRRLSLIK